MCLNNSNSEAWNNKVPLYSTCTCICTCICTCTCTCTFIVIILYLLTVAGEATARSCTSNNMCILLVSLILSELARHNILLSSNTVFMFSIHKASTGPSQITHLWSSVVSYMYMYMYTNIIIIIVHVHVLHIQGYSYWLIASLSIITLVLSSKY